MPVSMYVCLMQEARKRLIVCTVYNCNLLAAYFAWKFCCILTDFLQIAVVEGLYMLFRELLPQQATQRGKKIIEDQDVFENSLYCWAHLLSKIEVYWVFFEQKLVFPTILYRYYLCSLNVSYLALFWQKQASNHEVYAPISLVSKDGDHFCEPVRVPGVPDVFERAYVLQKIKGTNSTERV